ncbi:MAG: hypothetical protein WCK35_14500, partial [Chloroflexota bacterium]
GETAPFSKYENRGRRQAKLSKRELPPLNSCFWEFGAALASHVLGEEGREGVKCQFKQMKQHAKRLA